MELSYDKSPRLVVTPALARRRFFNRAKLVRVMERYPLGHYRSRYIFAAEAALSRGSSNPPSTTKRKVSA